MRYNTFAVDFEAVYTFTGIIILWTFARTHTYIYIHIGTFMFCIIQLRYREFRSKVKCYTLHIIIQTIHIL